MNKPLYNIIGILPLMCYYNCVLDNHNNNNYCSSMSRKFSRSNRFDTLNKSLNYTRNSHGLIIINKYNVCN